jgi:hypothetical protein
MSLTQQQRSEFFSFVEGQVRTTKSDFIKAMYERLSEDKDLTPNMINALNNAIQRANPNTQPATKKQTKTFKMRKWWVNVAGIDSRVVTVEIQAETQRAYKVVGHADIVNGSWCMRCGRKLTQPASFTIGFGADCASKIGIPYPAELNTMTQDELDKYKQDLLGVLRNQKFETWIPKSQIEEVYKDTP